MGDVSCDPAPAATARRRAVGTAVLALAAAIAFGGVDQYLGSLYSPFATAVSLMSAPWLLLPFVIGAYQPSWRRAAWLGLAASCLAVLAYIIMINSPMEGAHLTLRAIAASARSQRLNLLGGLVTGPVYGALGSHWRTSRSVLSASVAAMPLLAEPVIAGLGLRYSIDTPANYAEAVAGLLLAGFFAAAFVRARRRPATDPA